MVEATQPDSFNLFVALAARVTIAVIPEDEASGAAGDDGEAADAALEDRKEASASAQTPSAASVLHCTSVHISNQ